MRRIKSITVRTQQDMEAACKRLDDREREVLDDFGEDIAEGEYEQRARWASNNLDGFDNGW